MNQFDLPTNSNHEPIRLDHYFFILPNHFIQPKNETKSALGKGRTWFLLLRLETLCLYHYTTRAIANRVRSFYRTQFSLIFLPDTFQFDLFIGHISIWPFYRTLFDLTYFRTLFNLTFFRTLFNLTFLPDAFQCNLFTGHIWVRRIYRTHLSLTFSPDTFRFNLFPDTFRFDFFSGHFSIWPFSGHFSIWPFNRLLMIDYSRDLFVEIFEWRSYLFFIDRKSYLVFIVFLYLNVID